MRVFPSFLKQRKKAYQTIYEYAWTHKSLKMYWSKCMYVTRMRSS